MSPKPKPALPLQPDWRAGVLEQEKKRVLTLALEQKHLEKADSLLPDYDIPQRDYGGLSKEGYIELYRLLFLIPEMEARLTRLYRQGKIVGDVYLSKGT
ncbi:MAG: hypothetical protein FJY65_12030 [Calditrichaeota bacterium]|nr:hypothetical protein [Calditrichota bacterium]